MEVLVKLLDGGMTTARLNLSHGTQEQNLNLLAKLKMALRLRPHLTCALMVELRGREVRLSNLRAQGNTMKVKAGAQIKMQGNDYPMPSDESNFRISNDVICSYLKSNDIIQFDDGKVVGIVRAVNDSTADLEVKMGGVIKGNASCRFVGGKHSQLELIQKQDLKDITAISQKYQIDFLAVPHIASG